MKKRLRIFILLILAVAAGVTLHDLFFKKPFLYAGTLEATDVDLSSQVSSPISAVKVQEGDRVKTGKNSSHFPATISKWPKRSRNPTSIAASAFSVKAACRRKLGTKSGTAKKIWTCGWAGAASLRRSMARS